MKRIDNLLFLLPLLLLVFAFMSCDTDEFSVGTLEDAVERIPDVEPITGAENVTMNVKNDRNRSYFIVNISNVDRNSSVSNGTYYGWCAQMPLPINTGEDYTGVALLSTDKDKWINKVTYIVNNRRSYELTNPGITWREIQVAIWVILETMDYKLEAIKDDLPSSVNGYNPAYVNNILLDVQQNSDGYSPVSGDINLILTNEYEEAQSILLQAETAWMFCEDLDCDADEASIPLQNGQSWGTGFIWDLELVEEEVGTVTNTFTRPLVAGQHYEIGYVEFKIVEDGGEKFIEVTLKIDPLDPEGNFWLLTQEVHIYIDDDVVPGQDVGTYPFGEEFGDELPDPTDTYVELIPYPEGSYFQKGQDIDYNWTGADQLKIAVHTKAMLYYFP